AEVKAESDGMRGREGAEEEAATAVQRLQSMDGAVAEPLFQAAEQAVHEYHATQGFQGSQGGLACEAGSAVTDAGATGSTTTAATAAAAAAADTPTPASAEVVAAAVLGAVKVERAVERTVDDSLFYVLPQLDHLDAAPSTAVSSAPPPLVPLPPLFDSFLLCPTTGPALPASPQITALNLPLSAAQPFSSALGLCQMLPPLPSTGCQTPRQMQPAPAGRSLDGPPSIFRKRTRVVEVTANAAAATPPPASCAAADSAAAGADADGATVGGGKGGEERGEKGKEGGREAEGVLESGRVLALLREQPEGLGSAQRRAGPAGAEEAPTAGGAGEGGVAKGSDAGDGDSDGCDKGGLLLWMGNGADSKDGGSENEKGSESDVKFGNEKGRGGEGLRCEKTGECGLDRESSPQRSVKCERPPCRRAAVKDGRATNLGEKEKEQKEEEEVEVEGKEGKEEGPGKEQQEEEHEAQEDPADFALPAAAIDGKGGEGGAHCGPVTWTLTRGKSVSPEGKKCARKGEEDGVQAGARGGGGMGGARAEGRVSPRKQLKLDGQVVMVAASAGAAGACGAGSGALPLSRVLHLELDAAADTHMHDAMHGSKPSHELTTPHSKKQEQQGASLSKPLSSSSTLPSPPLCVSALSTQDASSPSSLAPVPSTDTPSIDSPAATAPAHADAPEPRSAAAATAAATAAPPLPASLATLGVGGRSRLGTVPVVASPRVGPLRSGVVENGEKVGATEEGSAGREKERQESKCVQGTSASGADSKPCDSSDTAVAAAVKVGTKAGSTTAAGSHKGPALKAQTRRLIRKHIRIGTAGGTGAAAARTATAVAVPAGPFGSGRLLSSAAAAAAAKARPAPRELCSPELAGSGASVSYSGCYSSCSGSQSCMSGAMSPSVTPATSPPAAALMAATSTMASATVTSAAAAAPPPPLQMPSLAQPQLPLVHGKGRSRAGSARVALTAAGSSGGGTAAGTAASGAECASAEAGDVAVAEVGETMAVGGSRAADGHTAASAAPDATPDACGGNGKEEVDPLECAEAVSDVDAAVPAEGKPCTALPSPQAPQHKAPAPHNASTSPPCPLKHPFSAADPPADSSAAACGSAGAAAGAAEGVTGGGGANGGEAGSTAGGGGETGSERKVRRVRPPLHRCVGKPQQQAQAHGEGEGEGGEAEGEAAGGCAGVLSPPPLKRVAAVRAPAATAEGQGNSLGQAEAVGVNGGSTAVGGGEGAAGSEGQWVLQEVGVEGSLFSPTPSCAGMAGVASSLASPMSPFTACWLSGPHKAVIDPLAPPAAPPAVDIDEPAKDQTLGDGSGNNDNESPTTSSNERLPMDPA
ncbi:unnamed protein product, partial [Closterium sp. NIES-53]